MGALPYIRVQTLRHENRVLCLAQEGWSPHLIAVLHINEEMQTNSSCTDPKHFIQRDLPFIFSIPPTSGGISQLLAHEEPSVCDQSGSFPTGCCHSRMAASEFNSR